MPGPDLMYNADLEDVDVIRTHHLAAALQYRTQVLRL